MPKTVSVSRCSVAILLALGLGPLAITTSGQAAAPPVVTGQVTVINPPTSPVPANVVNPATSPALTSSTDDPGRIAYQSAGQINCASNVGPCEATFSVVPSNHRLVIEHVSGAIAVSSNPGSIEVILSQNVFGPTPSSTFIVTSLFTFGSVSRVGEFPFDQPVLVYFDAGQTPAVQVLTAVSNSIINYNGGITLTGYLLDCTANPCQPIAH